MEGKRGRPKKKWFEHFEVIAGSDTNVTGV